MNENTKTDDSDGFLRRSQKMQKTRILPLRWIGNACSGIAATSLVKAFDLQENDDFGYRFKFHSLVWKYFNRPYEKWGTYYTIDLYDKTEERLRYMEENGI